MRLFVLLALCGASLVAASSYPSAYYHNVDTRLGCPPEGYTALSPNSRLDRLPAGGKYALCETSAQFAEGGPQTWTMNSGVFRLRNSELLVDENLAIHFDFPARPDWTDVVVRGVARFDPIADWDGIVINGQPEEIHPYIHYPPFGNCGDLDTVLLESEASSVGAEPLLTFSNCKAATHVKKITLFDGQQGINFEDCDGMVLSDIFLVGDQDNRRREVPSGRVTRGNQFYDGIVLLDSSISILNAFIRADEYGVIVQGDSSLTLCEPFIESRSPEILFSASPAGTQFVAVAGITNLNFPDDVFFPPSGENQAMLVVLSTCPTVLDNNYSPQDWVGVYTRNVMTPPG